MYQADIKYSRGEKEFGINRDMGMLLCVFVCIIVLLRLAIRKQIEWLMNIVMRSILGIIAIYFINLALAEVGISLGVGINAVTVLTSGILGIPGLLALYGIEIYQTL